MTTSKKGPGSGASGGNPGGTYEDSGEDAGAAALAELAVRLQAHSESLRKDVLRLQHALTQINSAMALSADRVERLRSNTERLRAIFGSEQPESEKTESEKGGPESGGQRKEQRSGADRRSGLDRRRDAIEVAGLMRWIEGTTLDRRSGSARRAISDRREREKAPVGGSMTEASAPPSGPTTDAPDGEDHHVVSLAAYRKSRRPAP